MGFTKYSVGKLLGKDDAKPDDQDGPENSSEGSDEDHSERRKGSSD